MIVSTWRISMRTCGTEYSEFDGIVSRRLPYNINWCREPEKGPSNPKRRNLLAKTLRLQGVHLLKLRLPVKVDFANHRQRMSEFQSYQYPVFQS